MAEFSKLVVTKQGQALIAKVLIGMAKEVDFTKVAASKAEIRLEDLENLTELPDIMQEAKISRKAQTNAVAVQIETAFSNVDLTVGYPMRVLGLFAIDPDEGEILYAVTVETSGCCYMPPYNGITVSGAYIQLVTTVGNAESVSLEVDPSVFATIGNIKDVMDRLGALTRDTIMGRVFLPLSTSNGIGIKTRDGKAIAAHKPVANNSVDDMRRQAVEQRINAVDRRLTEQTNERISALLAEYSTGNAANRKLIARMEEQIASLLARIDAITDSRDLINARYNELARNIMRGMVKLPLATRDERAIGTRSGLMIAAVKNLGG